MKRRGGRRTPSPPNLDRSSALATTNANRDQARKVGDPHSGGSGVLSRFLTPLLGGSSIAAFAEPKSSNGADTTNGQPQATASARSKRKNEVPVLPGRRPKAARVADGGVTSRADSEGSADTMGGENVDNETSNGASNDQSRVLSPSKRARSQRLAGLMKGSSKGRRKVVLPGRKYSKKKAEKGPPPTEPGQLTSILKKPKPPPPPEPPVSVAYYETIGFGFRVFGQKPPLNSLKTGSSSGAANGAPEPSGNAAAAVEVESGGRGGGGGESETATGDGNNRKYDETDATLTSEPAPLHASAPGAPLPNLLPLPPPLPPLQRSLSWRDDSSMGSPLADYAEAPEHSRSPDSLEHSPPKCTEWAEGDSDTDDEETISLAGSSDSDGDGSNGDNTSSSNSSDRSSASRSSSASKSRHRGRTTTSNSSSSSGSSRRRSANDQSNPSKRNGRTSKRNTGSKRYPHGDSSTSGRTSSSIALVMPFLGALVMLTLHRTFLTIDDVGTRPSSLAPLAPTEGDYTSLVSLESLSAPSTLDSLVQQETASSGLSDLSFTIETHLGSPPALRSEDLLAVASVDLDSGVAPADNEVSSIAAPDLSMHSTTMDSVSSDSGIAITSVPSAAGKNEFDSDDVVSSNSRNGDPGHGADDVGGSVDDSAGSDDEGSSTMKSADSLVSGWRRFVAAATGTSSTLSSSTSKDDLNEEDVVNAVHESVESESTGAAKVGVELGMEVEDTEVEVDSEEVAAAAQVES